MGLAGNGEQETLGIWAGDGGEGARVLAAGLLKLKNRNVGDALIAVGSGLNGLPEAITALESEPSCNTAPCI
jgi:putative transposase